MVLREAWKRGVHSFLLERAISSYFSRHCWARKTESPEDVTHYDIRNAALQMKELLDYLHIEKAHILGYSMGGRLAITMACLYPEYVRSLLLENCTAGLEREDERKERCEKDERLADKIEREGIESFVTMWENIPLFETQKV